MGIETAAASLAATFVGHSTVLLELDGVRVLTDPLLRLRVGALIRHSPLPSAVVYRDLDAVIISHAHLDHLDVPSLRLIDKDTPVLAPLATKRLIKRLGFADVTEMEPGQSRDIGPVRIVATLALHGNTRYPMSEANALDLDPKAERIEGAHKCLESHLAVLPPSAQRFQETRQ